MFKHSTKTFLSPLVIGTLCVLLSAVLFSAKSVLVKIAYQYPVDATVLLTLRMIFALPFFLIMLYFSHRPKTSPTRRDYFGLWLAGVAGYYGASIFDFWGMEFISASLERLILFLYPTLTVFLAAIFFKKAISRQTWLAIIVSYMGMALVFMGNRHEESAHLFLGSSLVFLGALAYAGYLVASGELIPRFGAARFTVFALLIATLCCLIQFVVSRDISLLTTLPTPVWLLSAALGFFCTFLPATLLTQGIKRIGAPQAALISGISPVITLALGAWLLNDTLTLWQFVGAGLILLGVMFISYKPVSSEQ
jgi:drug/metabolite transporter (DMT)-like permease